MDKETVMEPAIINIGEILTAARMKAGWSQEQVAAKLHLKKEHIEKIEHNNFDDMKHNSTFVKGYIRSYARLFNVPKQQVDSAFAALPVEEAEPLKRNVVNKPSREFSIKDKKVRWITYAIVLLLLILVVIWWRSQVVNHVAPATTVTTTTPVNSSASTTTGSTTMGLTQANVQMSQTQAGATNQETFPMIANRVKEEELAQQQAQVAQAKPSAAVKERKPDVNKLHMDIQN